jgi:hypothetical protein
MKDYTSSKGKIAELEKLHRSLRDKRQADRVKAAIALSKRDRKRASGAVLRLGDGRCVWRCGGVAM